MACNSYTLNGLNAICKEGKGGILKVWIAPFDDVTYTVDASDNLVTIEDVSAFKCYAFRRNAASATTTGAYNDNAANTQGTDLTLDFLKQDAVKRLEISALLQSSTRAIYKDANEIYHFIGATYPVEPNANEAATGQALTDPNHYSITLHDEDDHLPYILDASTAERIELVTPPAI